MVDIVPIVIRSKLKTDNSMKFRVICYDGSNHEIDEDDVVTIKSFGLNNDLVEVLLDNGNRIFLDPNKNKNFMEWGFYA